MNRKHFATGITLLLLVVSGALFFAQSQTAASSLRNTDFEQDRNGSFPTVWTQENKLKPLGKASVESRPDLAGRALRLQPTNKNNNPNEPFGVVQILKVSDLPTGPLRLSVSMLGTDGATPVLLALPMSGDMKPTAVLDVTARAGSSFQTASREFEVGSATYLVIACVVAGTKGVAWFDDIKLESAASASSPVLPTQGQRKITPTITVDTGRLVRPVPIQLFGTNVEWIYSANGLWDAGKNVLNPSVIQTARKSGISTIRFPGGIFADFYHWRDGVGPIASRPSRQHSPSDKNVSPNFVGTHEIADVARQVGAELLLQVNIITGTPEEAAEWVAYSNSPNHPERSRNGSPQPFNVRYWEIGNESYMRGDNEAHRTGFLSPREYADRFLRFVTAMKRVDPSIKVGAIGGRNFDKYSFVTDQNWNSIVLGRAGSAIDFFAVHNAYAPVVASMSRRSTEDVYRAMFAFPLQVQRNLQDLEKEIESAAGPENARRIRIAVTEWGPYFHVIPSDPYLDHVKTLGSAIYAADIFATFLKTSKTDFANFFKLTDVAWLGWMGFDGVPKPVLLALDMFRNHFGTQLVETTVASPTYDSPETGMVAAERGVPSISAVSSLSADGKRLFVIAINKDLSSTLETDIVVKTGKPAQTLNVWSISGPSIDSNNGHRLPEIPGLKWANPARASANSMFDSGRPGTIAIRPSNIDNAASTFRVRLQPVSVSSFEIPLK
jgi:alpha-N-arabinofuranosidase